MYFCEAQLCQPQNQYIQNQDLQVASYTFVSYGRSGPDVPDIWDK